MEQVWEFLSFSDPAVRSVALGAMLISGVSAIVGVFTLLQKRALIGDAVSHSVLPGICLAFILSQVRDTGLLLIGAFISGWVSIIYTDYISRHTRLKPDAAIAIVLSFFFAIGIMLLTAIQQGGNAAQSGLDSFLFGRAASIMPGDLILFLLLGGLIAIIVLAGYHAFKVRIFDPEYAASIGMRLGLLDFVLTTLTVLAVAMGIRTVGVVLMAALLVTPAAAARYWTTGLVSMIGLSALIGTLSGLVGAGISYLAPAMPTGPWIIVTLSLTAFASMLFGTTGGIYQRLKRLHSFQRKVLRENVLKLFFRLGEGTGDFRKAYSVEEICGQTDMQGSAVRKGLSLLRRNSQVHVQDGKWSLTDEGKSESFRVVRLHRLWETYLSEYLQVAPDHVHDDAEAMEHILTPELQDRLERLLAGRKLDPHHKKIPEL